MGFFSKTLMQPSFESQAWAWEPLRYRDGGNDANYHHHYHRPGYCTFQPFSPYMLNSVLMPIIILELIRSCIVVKYAVQK